MSLFYRPASLCQLTCLMGAAVSKGVSTADRQLSFSSLFLTLTAQRTPGKLKNKTKTNTAPGPSWDQSNQTLHTGAKGRGISSFPSPLDASSAKPELITTFASKTVFRGIKEGSSKTNPLGCLSESHKAPNSLQNSLQVCLMKLSPHSLCEIWDPGEDDFYFRWEWVYEW